MPQQNIDPEILRQLQQAVLSGQYNPTINGQHYYADTTGGSQGGEAGYDNGPATATRWTTYDGDGQSKQGNTGHIFGADGQYLNDHKWEGADAFEKYGPYIGAALTGYGLAGDLGFLGQAASGGAGSAATGLGPEWAGTLAEGGQGVGGFSGIPGASGAAGAAGSAGMSSADLAALYGPEGYGAAATPAELASAGAGSAGASSAGSGFLSGISGAGSLLGPAATLLGAAAGAGGTPGQESTTSKDIPEWMKPYVTKMAGYGSTLMDQSMSPERQAQWNALRNQGAAQASQPIAGNGFSKFFPGR